MKIIQSYAHFDEGTPRLDNIDNREKVNFNFYSFILSYLTLKKYYGHVTMYCNKRAVDVVVKYIPYDKVVIAENKNTTLFWSFYKVDTIRRMTEDFIHVDSDVFIFADLFSKFISSKEYNLIVQNQIPKEINYVNNYVSQYKEFLKNNNVFNPDLYDGRCLSCGTIGMRKELVKGYVKMCDAMKKEFIDTKFTDNFFIGMACEELALYLYSLENNLNFCEILPYEDVLKYGERGAGNYHNYTHMYLGSKFNPKYVKLIRNKILKDFPEQLGLVERYEKEMMKNTGLLELIS